jgi:hypothetical protein
MESNLPLGKLNRDELYTFIGGLFVSQVWFLYLLSYGKIEVNDSLYIPLGIMLWIGSTAIIFLLNSLLYILSNIFQREVMEEDFNKIEKVQYSVNVDEKRMLLHIYAVTFSSLLSASLPTVDYICTSKFSNYWIIALAVPLILSLVLYLYASKEYKIIYKCVIDGKCKYIDPTIKDVNEKSN